MRLQARAPAKINVCLLLGPVRPSDGRHEIVTVLQSLRIADRLVLTVDEEAAVDRVRCPGVAPDDNLVTAAVALFRERTGWRGPPVAIEIDKRLPIAGGMAGGSADAGAALRMLAQASGMAIDDDELERLAFELGADVPAQIRPGRALATGAGDRLERIPGVGRYGVVIVPAADGLSTAAVFAEADRLGLPRSAGELATGLDVVRAGLPDLADELCVNELEPATLSLRPELESTLARLRDEGADVAMISGSGPTALGLFHDVGRAQEVAERIDHAVFSKPVGLHAGEVT